MAGAIGLPQIQELMRRYLDEDREKTSVAAEAVSLEEALRNAAIQLECPVASLDFEIVEKGVSGTLGLGRKPWRVRAYKASVKKEVAAAAVSPFGEDLLSEDSGAALEPKDKDGGVFVRLSADGALLKVTSPIGRGRRATEKAAMDKLHERAIHDINQPMVREVVRLASGEYVNVGSFPFNPANDALLTVDVGEQDMKAYVMLSAPGPGGCELSAEVILSFLKSNKVIYGIKEDVLQEIEDLPRYREPILVAEGVRPQNGNDATMQFDFEVDQTTIHLKETSDGRMNFKELGLIKNVVAGQPLARKVPAENAIPGRTVTGKILPARNGKDIPLPLGKNVRVADDGITVLAVINGQVIFSAERSTWRKCLPSRVT